MTASEVPPQFYVLARDAEHLLGQGDAIDSIIRFVHGRTGIIGTLWVIHQILGTGLKETRDLVEWSPALNPEGYVPPSGWGKLVASLGLH